MGSTAQNLILAFDANPTDTSFTTKTASTSEPSGDGIFDLFDIEVAQAQENKLPKYLQVIPFGADANNETFAMRVYGWSKVKGSALYLPQMLVELDVVLGNIAATNIAADNYLADTISIAAGDGNVSLASNALDAPASALIHLRGCRWIEFAFDCDEGASASASANCYWRTMDQD